LLIIYINFLLNTFLYFLQKVWQKGVTALRAATVSQYSNTFTKSMAKGVATLRVATVSQYSCEENIKIFMYK